MRRIIDLLRRQRWRLHDTLLDRVHGRAHRQKAFQRIHDQNLWGDAESKSGSGSGTAATAVIRRELPALLQRHGVKAVLDAPCGDFYWMKDVARSLDRYAGADIVPDLIEQNTARYGSASVTFTCADISVDPLPAADLVLCRDCFIHLPTRMIRGALENFRRTGARFLLLTSDRPAVSYHDIPIGSFRPVDFTAQPFSFPPPIDAIDEDASGNRQLCLWRLQSLPAEWVGADTRK